MRSRCDQRDQVKAIFFAYSVKFLFLFKWYIRQDQSIHTDLCCFLNETFCSIRKYYVCVSHKHHRNGTVLSYINYHIKYFIGSHSTGKCSYICSLDHRAFCCRVGEWDSKFDQVCTCLFHCVYKLFCYFQRRISAGNERDKCFSFFKCFCNSLIHGYPPLCNVRLLRSLYLHVRRL